jgi:hypothetical protein
MAHAADTAARRQRAARARGQQAGCQAGWQAGRLAGWQAGRLAGRQAGRQAGRRGSTWSGVSGISSAQRPAAAEILPLALSAPQGPPPTYLSLQLPDPLTGARRRGRLERRQARLQAADRVGLATGAGAGAGAGGGVGGGSPVEEGRVLARSACWALACRAGPPPCCHSSSLAKGPALIQKHDALHRSRHPSQGPTCSAIRSSLAPSSCWFSAYHASRASNACTRAAWPRAISAISARTAATSASPSWCRRRLRRGRGTGLRCEGWVAALGRVPRPRARHPPGVRRGGKGARRARGSQFEARGPRRCQSVA